MKKLISVLLTLVLVFGLVACGDKADTKDTEEKEKVEEVVEEKEEEAEDEKLILDYNPQDQSLYYQEETSEFFIEFDFVTDPITGEGYVKLSLWQ